MRVLDLEAPPRGRGLSLRVPLHRQALVRRELVYSKSSHGGEPSEQVQAGGQSLQASGRRSLAQLLAAHDAILPVSEHRRRRVHAGVVDDALVRREAALAAPPRAAGEEGSPQAADEAANVTRGPQRFVLMSVEALVGAHAAAAPAPPMSVVCAACAAKLCSACRASVGAPGSEGTGHHQPAVKGAALAGSKRKAAPASDGDRDREGECRSDSDSESDSDGDVPLRSVFAGRFVRVAVVDPVALARWRARPALAPAAPAAPAAAAAGRSEGAGGVGAGATSPASSCGYINPFSKRARKGGWKPWDPHFAGLRALLDAEQALAREALPKAIEKSIAFENVWGGKRQGGQSGAAAAGAVQQSVWDVM